MLGCGRRPAGGIRGRKRRGVRASKHLVVRGILLIDHGSRREAANRRLRELAAGLARLLAERGEVAVVEHAHMELAEPDVSAGLTACVEKGASHVVAVPCMLSRGRHVTEDIPSLLEQAARHHAGVTFEVALPLSEQPGFLELLRRAAGGGSGDPPGDHRKGSPL